MSERAVQFYFQGQIQSVVPTDITRTVLQYLREDCHVTGTKEGCAEGDCGACAVVIGELSDQDGHSSLVLKTVNSCIQFLPTLDGKALFTVEDVGRIGASAALAARIPTITLPLHPVQQSLVTEHGSQCGFCTPGFVMSLWAMYEDQVTCPDRETVMDALSGNLCRCTGYRPILDAAEQAYELPRTVLSRQPVIDALLDLKAADSLVCEANGRMFAAPQTLATLADLRIEYPKARLLAGSTDVGLWVTKQGRVLDQVIYLGQVDELKRIIHHADYLEIGAMVSLTDAFAALIRQHAGWTELARRFASRPVQNAGTLGGNIANGSPIGDSMPALIVLGASLLLQQGDTLRELPLDQFYLAYQQTALRSGEFVRSIRIPHPFTGVHFATYKVSKRFEQDISAVCAAFAVTLDPLNHTVSSVRIAYGGMAATPKRATETEQFLIDKAWHMEALITAQAKLTEDFNPLSDGRASRDYRQMVAANLLLRFFLETNSDTSSRRLMDVMAEMTGLEG